MTGSRYQQFFAEMKRRRVFRVIAVYGIVGFVLIQIMELAVPALLLPDWTYRFVALLLLVGFPVSIVLAWAFEVTPAGVVRTTEAAPGELSEIMAAPASHHWPGVLLAAVGVTALVAGSWYAGRQSAPAAEFGVAAGLVTGVRLAYVDLADDPRPSIAVLPFADMSPESDQEYFSDGMTEEIINVLAQVRDLRVAARTSTFALKDSELTAVQLGDTLHVGFLVEGSVRKAGDQVRITAQLIDSSDGSHLWSHQYDRPLNDVFQIQTEIAEAIAEALTVPLGLNDPADLVTPTADLEAYDLYLAGRARLRERGSGVFEAIELFKAAVARDSAWAPAWAGLGNAMSISHWYGYSSDSAYIAQTLAAAEPIVLRALELDPRHPTALVALGSIHRDRLEWNEAEAAYHQALVLDPDNAEAHQQYAEWLLKRGRISEALQSVDRAVELDPAPVRVHLLAYILEFDDRWDEVEEVLAWAVARGMNEKYRQIEEQMRRVPNRRAFSEGRYEDLVFPSATPADGEDIRAFVQALRTANYDAVPYAMRDGLSIWDLVQLQQPDLAVGAFRAVWKENFRSSEFVWRTIYDEIRADDRIRSLLESRGLEDVTVQRTPIGERVRPAILRQGGGAEPAT